VTYPVTRGEAFDRMRRAIRSETWVPIRTVYMNTYCWLCGDLIPRAKPGCTTGTRGTKAWWCKERDVCECTGCRSEAMRAWGG